MKKILLTLSLVFLSCSVSAFNLKDIASSFTGGQKSSNQEYQTRAIPTTLNNIDAYMPNSNSEWAYNVQRNRYSGKYNMLGRVSSEICFESAYENPMVSGYTELRQKAYYMGGNLVMNVRVSTERNIPDATCPNKLKMSGMAVNAERKSSRNNSTTKGMLSLFK